MSKNILSCIIRGHTGKDHFAPPVGWNTVIGAFGFKKRDRKISKGGKNLLFSIFFFPATHFFC
jgi:hypothetical protein